MDLLHWPIFKRRRSDGRRLHGGVDRLKQHTLRVCGRSHGVGLGKAGGVVLRLLRLVEQAAGIRADRLPCALVTLQLRQQHAYGGLHQPGATRSEERLDSSAKAVDGARRIVGNEAAGVSGQGSAEGDGAGHVEFSDSRLRHA